MGVGWIDMRVVCEVGGNYVNENCHGDGCCGRIVLDVDDIGEDGCMG